MTDHIKTAAEAVSESQTLGRGRVIAVAAVTLYGGYAATRDGLAKIKQIRANRKAKKAAEVVETDAPQQ